MSDEIRFYRSDEKPYGAFSNLFRSHVRFGARDFPTAEHAYQFQKPKKLDVRQWLMAAPSPSLLAMAAHGLYTWDIVEGWSQKKVSWMRCVLWSKFGQNADLRRLLLSTGRTLLIETAKTDNAVNRYWGQVAVEGKPGHFKGQNMLGTLLMGVREDFRVGTITEDAVRGLAEGLDPDTGLPDLSFEFHPRATE